MFIRLATVDHLYQYYKTIYANWHSLQTCVVQIWWCTPTFSDQIFLGPFFASFTDKLFFAMATSKQPLLQIYSTRLHASFANFLQWLHLNNLTYFHESNCDRRSTNFFVSESWAAQIWWKFLGHFFYFDAIGMVHH